MRRDRLHVRCPGCAGDLVVDAETGEVLSHEPAERKPAAGKDFDDLLRGVDEEKARAEERFEQERAAVRDRDRLLEAKFREALRRAEDDDATPPPRPFDFD